jgi:tripartite-type tricarboxylate transporter receptor subunit TctC
MNLQAATWLRTALGAALLAFGALAAADSPLRVIVPFAAGGGGDLLARMLAPVLSAELRMPVVVENRPGANGMIGMQRVKAAAREERIIVLASDHAALVAPLTSSSTRQDPLKDLAIVGLAARYPYVLAVRPEGAQSLEELRSQLRKMAGPTSIAIPAEGGLPELVARGLEQATGKELTSIPYRGGMPAVQALLGGQVTAAAVGISNVLPLHREGKLTILAVSGARRLSAAPDIPTFEEAGLPGLTTAGSWAVYAPKNTAMDLEALNRALRIALAQESVRARLRAVGLEPLSMAIADSRSALERSIEASTQLMGGRH